MVTSNLGFLAILNGNTHWNWYLLYAFAVAIGLNFIFHLVMKKMDISSTKLGRSFESIENGKFSDVNVALGPSLATMLEYCYVLLYVIGIAVGVMIFRAYKEKFGDSELNKPLIPE